MRLKVLALTALIVCIFAIVPAFALEAGFVYAPESLSPGKAERICISVDTDCAITLELLDSQYRAYPAQQFANWNRHAEPNL